MNAPASSTPYLSHTAFSQLQETVTHSATISWPLASLSLTPIERWAALLLKEGGYPALPDDDTPQNERILALRRLSHRFSLGENAGTGKGGAALFRVELTSHDWKRYCRARDEIVARQVTWLKEIQGFLNDVAREGSLRPRLHAIREMLLHMPPVVTFVGNHLFSSLTYWDANLIDRRERPGLLSRLSELPPDEWSPEESQLIFALLMLLESGDYYRLEEINGLQVDPSTLEEILDRKLAEFGTAGSAIHGIQWQSSGIDVMRQKAHELRRLQQAIEPAVQFYRVVNGLCLNKTLRFFSRRMVDERTFPSALVQSFERLFPGCLGELETEEEPFLRSLALRSLAEGKVEALLQALVVSGLAETHSDFFMSRGPRSLGLPQCYWRLQKPDFFCVVLARPNFDPAAHGLTYSIGEMCWNQSLRMQFNSWKFWYGNLTDDEKDPRQYWFYPPKLPDISQGENLLHAGHRQNGVVQSVRSPAELALTDFSTGERRVFHAAYDARAVRSREQPRYTERDIATTIQHQIWIGQILQSLADESARQGKPVFVESFDRAFHCGPSGPEIETTPVCPAQERRSRNE